MKNKMTKQRLMELAGVNNILNEGYAWEREEGGALPTLASSTKKHNASSLGEQVNPEMDRLVKSFIEGIAQRNDYGNHDALYAVFESLKRLKMLGKDINFRPF